mmetsp:Transcript_14562/g.32071  ORF Transcript_14562/g.32071 Transcript_14562/m.32071 type:complete len:235 (+) Transcript_14562:987-1691(+)
MTGTTVSESSPVSSFPAIGLEDGSCPRRDPTLPLPCHKAGGSSASTWVSTRTSTLNNSSSSRTWLPAPSETPMLSSSSPTNPPGSSTLRRTAPRRTSLNPISVSLWTSILPAKCAYAWLATCTTIPDTLPSVANGLRRLPSFPPYGPGRCSMALMPWQTRRTTTPLLTPSTTCPSLWSLGEEGLFCTEPTPLRGTSRWGTEGTVTSGSLPILRRPPPFVSDGSMSGSFGGGTGG